MGARDRRNSTHPASVGGTIVIRGRREYQTLGSGRRAGNLV
jgi:hypothetical protein